MLNYQRVHDLHCWALTVEPLVETLKPRNDTILHGTFVEGHRDHPPAAAPEQPALEGRSATEAALHIPYVMVNLWFHNGSSMVING